jgi:hypothetical protein
MKQLLNNIPIPHIHVHKILLYLGNEWKFNKDGLE